MLLPYVGLVPFGLFCFLTIWIYHLQIFIAEETARSYLLKHVYRSKAISLLQILY